MKPLSLCTLAMALMLTACQRAPASLQTLIQTNDVDTAVSQAKQTGELKILVANLRGSVAPGLSTKQLAQAQALCGDITLPNVGDVKTPENRDYIESALAFAKDYNLRVYALCVQKSQ